MRRRVTPGDDDSSEDADSPSIATGTSPCGRGVGGRWSTNNRRRRRRRERPQKPSSDPSANRAATLLLLVLATSSLLTTGHLHGLVDTAQGFAFRHHPSSFGSRSGSPTSDRTMIRLTLLPPSCRTAVVAAARRWPRRAITTGALASVPPPAAVCTEVTPTPPRRPRRPGDDECRVNANATTSGPTTPAAAETGGNETSASLDDASSASRWPRGRRRRSRECRYLFPPLHLPEGLCVGLTCNTSLSEALTDPTHWLHSSLHPDEIALGARVKGDAGRDTFFLGRLAMRRALRRLSCDEGVEDRSLDEEQEDLDGGEEEEYDGYARDEFCSSIPTDLACILRDEHGRPDVPRGFLGSISHKRSVGVALVTVDEDHEELGAGRTLKPTRGVGVDIEQCASRKGRTSIGRRVLTPRELDDLGKIEGVTKEQEVLLRFSLKESVYKAMHPIICQHVGFQEAEVAPHSNGTATVWYNLTSGAHEQFVRTTAHWRRVGGGDVDDDGGYFLTSASVTASPV